MYPEASNTIPESGFYMAQTSQPKAPEESGSAKLEKPLPSVKPPVTGEITTEEGPQEKTTAEFKVTTTDANPDHGIREPNPESDATLSSSSRSSSLDSDNSKAESQTNSSALNEIAAEKPSSSEACAIKFNTDIKENEINIFAKPDLENYSSVFQIGSQLLEKDKAQGRYELSMESASDSQTDALSPDHNALFNRLLCGHIFSKSLYFYTTNENPANKLNTAKDLINIVKAEQPDETYKYYIDLSFKNSHYCVMSLLPEESDSKITISLTMTRISDIPGKSSTPEQKSSSTTKKTPGPKNNTPDETVTTQSPKTSSKENNEDTGSSCGLLNCFGLSSQTIRSRHANNVS